MQNCSTRLYNQTYPPIDLRAMLDPVLGGFNFLPPSTETEEPILDVSDLSNSLRAVSDDALSSLLLWEIMYVSLEEDRPLESWDSI